MSTGSSDIHTKGKVSLTFCDRKFKDKEPMKPALLLAGKKVVVGENHGIAYGKLTADEQEAQFLSGFFDPDTKKFMDDEMKPIWLKKIILIRHAHVQQLHVTSIGRQQAHAVADFLFNTFDLELFRFIASPVDRCVETLQEITKVVSADYCVDDRFAEKQTDEDAGHFTKRLHECVDELPDNSIVCTHCDCIFNLLSFSLTKMTLQFNIPYCSSSCIDNGMVLWVGRAHDIEKELLDEDNL